MKNLVRKNEVFSMMVAFREMMTLSLIWGKHHIIAQPSGAASLCNA